MHLSKEFPAPLGTGPRLRCWVVVLNEHCSSRSCGNENKNDACNDWYDDNDHHDDDHDNYNCDNHIYIMPVEYLYMTQKSDLSSGNFPPSCI